MTVVTVYARMGCGEDLTPDRKVVFVTADDSVSQERGRYIF